MICSVPKLSILMCRKALEPLVKAGYVAFVYGGAKEGAFLCKHELVEALHLTGSAATYDAIVWGANKSKVLTAPSFHAKKMSM